LETSKTKLHVASIADFGKADETWQLFVIDFGNQERKWSIIEVSVDFQRDLYTF
jgi:hypothetical protein